MEEKSLRGLGDSLITAIDLFNNQQWHEAHDVLEDIWNYLDGDERQIIQGILQVSVSQLHLTRKNTNGGTILLGEGLGRLKTRKDIDLGIDLEDAKNKVDKDTVALVVGHYAVHPAPMDKIMQFAN